MIAGSKFFWALRVFVKGEGRHPCCLHLLSTLTHVNMITTTHICSIFLSHPFDNFCVIITDAEQIQPENNS